MTKQHLRSFLSGHVGPPRGIPILLRHGRQPAYSTRDTTAIASAHVHWKETPECHIFKVDLLGLRKEDVKVEVEDGRVLHISGDRSRDQEHKDHGWHCIKRNTGKFMRRFRLHGNSKMEEVKALMENRVLTMTVPKKEEKKPEVKPIQITG